MIKLWLNSRENSKIFALPVVAIGVESEKGNI
jgi:hypothetical protein